VAADQSNDSAPSVSSIDDSGVDSSRTDERVGSVDSGSILFVGTANNKRFFYDFFRADSSKVP
jgi:hypothetical protein